MPKLAGELIDVAIRSQQGGASSEAAKQQTNAILAQIVAVVVVGGVAGGVRRWALYVGLVRQSGGCACLSQPCIVLRAEHPPVGEASHMHAH